MVKYTKDNIKLSPVFWEKMIGMEPVDLAQTLRDGLEKNPSWIMDQAVCASRNVRLTSPEYSILTAFCNAHAGQLAQTDLPIGIKAAITGLDAVAGDEDALQEACDEIINIYRKMTVFNRAKAIDSIQMHNAGLGRNHPLQNAFAEYLLEILDDADFGMFKYIADHADVLSPESRLAFINKIEQLQNDSPVPMGGVPVVLEHFLMSCADMGQNDAGFEKAFDMLYGSPDMPFAVIKKPEDPKTPQKPTYDVKDNVITLHPRRDPQ